jgi:outer membrane protein OmpA-like peptidoglycan-associated protein
MREGFRAAVMVTVLAVCASGCATRGWVQQLMAKKSEEVDQRFATVDERTGTQVKRLDQVEGRVKEESQRVGQVEERFDGRVKSLESSVGETGELAKTAQGRADAAFARADEADARVSRLATARRTRNIVEAVRVQFGFNRAELDDRAQTALLPLVRDLRENPKLTVDLEGFTDQTGPRDYNIQLSQRRVEAVRRYLVEQGVAMPRIHAIGLGPSNGHGTPETPAQKRRVTVRLMVDAD